MADKIENKVEKKESKPVVATAHEHSHEGHDHAHEHKPVEKAVEHKKPIVKKDEAVAIINGASISKKHSMYIADFIKNKTIELAISQLEEVIKFKRAIPFKGEIPHRHELGGRPGRFPINACKVFIPALKGLKGNAIVNGMDISKLRIFYGSATWASRSAKRGGARFKRVHIVLKAKEFPEAKK